MTESLGGPSAVATPSVVEATAREDGAAILIQTVAVVALVAFFWVSARNLVEQQLDVIAAVTEVKGPMPPVVLKEGMPAAPPTAPLIGWAVHGRVVDPSIGGAIRSTVWGVMSDGRGNRMSSNAVQTSADGSFVLDQFPARIRDWEKSDASQIIVYAVEVAGDSTRAGERRNGSTNLRLSEHGRSRMLPPSPRVALVLLGIFAFSVLLGLIQPRTTSAATHRNFYLASVLLSFAFVLAMVSTVAVSLRTVHEDNESGDVIRLGFAQVYHGSYVKDVPDEWLFSLTAAPPIDKLDGLATGFGIPMWLLLMSVLGSGLFTVALLVRHVKGQERALDHLEYRARIEALVRHQFYLLFSPFGAIVVYQILVAAGLGGATVTVALAMFAAGSFVNVILDRAVTVVDQLLRSTVDARVASSTPPSGEDTMPPVPPPPAPPAVPLAPRTA